MEKLNNSSDQCQAIKPKIIRGKSKEGKNKTRADKKPNIYGPTKYIFWGSNGIDCSDESTWDILLEDFSGVAFDLENTPKEKDVNKPLCFVPLQPQKYSKKHYCRDITNYQLAIY